MKHGSLRKRGAVFRCGRGRLAVKLPAQQVASLVDSEVATAFETGGRKMKVWAAIPPQESPQLWTELTADAFAYCEKLTAN